MRRVNAISLAVVVLIAFVASSLWYSSLMFGPEFLALSGSSSTPQPNALRGVSELFRTSVLAYVIVRLMIRLDVSGWRDALGMGLLLWIGFPVVLLTGSILWQNVPWQLAAIHSGDWLIKLVLIPVTIAIWPKRFILSPGK